MTRILLVEDDPQMARGLSYNLEAEGYEVVIAAAGDDGLKHARSGSYDLLLLDVMLPKRSGFEVCDAGPLSAARYLEPTAMLWIHLAYQQGLGPNIGFRLVRPL